MLRRKVSRELLVLTLGFASSIGAQPAEALERPMGGSSRGELHGELRGELGGELRGELALEWRQFIHSGAYTGQERQSQPTIRVEGEWYKSWNKGQDALVIAPMLRGHSADRERRYGDIRELKWVHRWGPYQLTLGVAQTFWGVAESQHLVDVINQWDLRGREDGEEKLGQPMVHLNAATDIGNWNLYLLPGFREREFGEDNGRFRPGLPVDEAQAEYESRRENRKTDLALRWSHYVGDWDIGLSWFSGTQRTPRLLANNEATQLIPHYDVMQQLSLDVQATLGPWLWKHESLYRRVRHQTQQAVVTGFEYTAIGAMSALTGKHKSRGDLGLLLEYHWHSDGDAETILYQNDLFVGARLALNDPDNSTLLLGVLYDLDTHTRLLSLEASRRLSAHWSAAVDLRWLDSAENDQWQLFEQDDYVQIGISYFF